MTSEQERWAEALAVLKLRADRAELFVAERIGSLALDGETAGIQCWQEIASRLDQLIRPSAC